MQYKMIEPYLKRKTPTGIGDKQLFQSVDDRKKLVCITYEKVFPHSKNSILLGWHVRMYSLRLLFNIMSKLLVECR